MSDYFHMRRNSSMDGFMRKRTKKGARLSPSSPMVNIEPFFTH